MLNDGEDIFEQAMSFKGQYHTLFKALKKHEANHLKIYTARKNVRIG